MLATSHKNFQTDLHEIFREGWQWTREQMVKFWWRSGSPSGYRHCFPDSLLLGDTESGINRLRCATLQCTSYTSRHRHSNYDVITSPAHDRQQDWYRDTDKTCLGGGMHWSSASSSICFLDNTTCSRIRVYVIANVFEQFIQSNTQYTSTQ